MNSTQNVYTPENSARKGVISQFNILNVLVYFTIVYSFLINQEHLAFVAFSFFSSFLFCIFMAPMRS